MSGTRNGAAPSQGPLRGLRIVEMGAIGPVPFCGMVLADLGADVVCIERLGTLHDAADVTSRGKRLVQADLQDVEGQASALELICSADVLLEGFRPGVMERLGLGPGDCLARNPTLVYGRMTGWGQAGPLAHAAGHDINYIAVTGALHAIGRAHDSPPPPLNLVGDYGGGAMLLAVGVLAALREVQDSGKGQVIDAAMVDGAALLTAPFLGLRRQGQWGGGRGENLLDGGAPFYDTYACADGKFVAIGPLEPKFFQQFCELCGLGDDFFGQQKNRPHWPMMKLRLKDMFLTRTRDEWCKRLEGTDACFAPVLDWDEAPRHPHNMARNVFVSVDGVVQPAPAPRFSATPAMHPRPARPSSIEAVAASWAPPSGIAGPTS